MQPDEICRLVDLVADKVEARLCTKGTVPGASSEAERRAQLRADLEALAIQFSVRDEVIAQVRGKHQNSAPGRVHLC